MLPAATGPDLWLGWFGLALLGGFLALDETAFAQTWLAQPLPAALAAGLVLGDPGAALLPGVLMQLLVLANLPVGATASLDATSATVGVVGGALLAGWRPEGLAALAAGLDPGRAATAGAWPLGLALLLMALASWAAGRLVTAERGTHLVWKLRAYRLLRDGSFDVAESLHRRALRLTVMRGAATTLAVAMLVAAGWRPLVAIMPDLLRDALALAPLLAAPLAVGALGDRFGLPRAAPLLAAGVVAGLLLGRVLW
jgi:mannose/fructose/N-acetylgalactosamine-specific phosphotransferase system component IIC